MRISQGLQALGLRGVRTDRYTFVINQDDRTKRSVLLFDRKEDPYEMKNLAADNPEKVKELSSELGRWLKKYNDPWLPNLWK